VEAGLAALAEAGAGADLSGWAPWHAARGDLLCRAGRQAEAAGAFEAALKLTSSLAERLHLKRRLAEVRGVRLSSGTQAREALVEAGTPPGITGISGACSPA
jgi:hypothetical protein